MSINNAIPTEESLLEFGEVYLRAIELAWRDEGFKQLLLADPMYALEHYFHYRSTWNFKFKVTEVNPNSHIHGKKVGWHPEAKGGIGEWVLPKCEMSFGLPRAPADPKQFGVALALYNDAGPMYLFSCC